MKFFVYTVIGIVAASIVAGFFIIGSPNKERLRKFDERRANDLNSLQSQIINFWQRKGILPEKLDDLKDDVGGVIVFKDPQTNEEYGYEVKGKEEFSLCATFSISSDSLLSGNKNIKVSYPGYYQSVHWEHKEGRVCFERKIDKDFYKPFEADRIPPAGF